MLVKKADYNTKISEYNKFTKNTPDAKKDKTQKLVNESNISHLVKKFGFKHKTCNNSNKSRIKSRSR